MTLAVIQGNVSWMAPLHWVYKPNTDSRLVPGALQNHRNMLEHHPLTMGAFVYDVFRDAIVVTRPLPGTDEPMSRFPRDLADADETACAAWLSIVGLTATIATTAHLIREIAFRHALNPMAQWLDGLVWDGKPRIETWLVDYAGVEDTEYTRLVGRRFLISAVARAMRPGCKVDTMLVLEGPQGIRKSSMAAALCGIEYFTDQIGDIRSKESSQLIQGYWIIEVPEMDKMKGKEASAVKEFISRQTDKYRPPYGRNVVTRGRRCVFIGTLNPNGVGYIHDTTGARRFWPVECKTIDLDSVRRDRNQLWAEAVCALECGEKWWIEADEAHLVASQQEARIDEDVWAPKVAEWLSEKPSGHEFTSGDALTSAVYVDTKLQTNAEKQRIAPILYALGCKQGPKKINGKTARVWRKP